MEGERRRRGGQGTVVLKVDAESKFLVRVMDDRKEMAMMRLDEDGERKMWKKSQPTNYPTVNLCSLMSMQP